MSELDSRYVYRGFWVNHSKGPVMGRTITTDASTAVIVTALVAIISTLGIAHLWNLLIFFYHQICATGEPMDPLLKQQQVLFRTLPTPASLTMAQIKLWWVWRRKHGYAPIRGIFAALLPLAFAVGALFASIFSSYIIATSNLEVLVQSPFCGTVDFDKLNSVGGGRYSKYYESNGESYGFDCYQNSSTLPARCRNVYVQSKLPFAVTSGPCPFAPSMCITDDSPSTIVDSGLLEVSRYFGLNIRAKDDVKFRRRTQCVVLPVGDHIRIVNRSELGDAPTYGWPPPYNITDEPYITFLYGGDPFSRSGPWENLTYQESLWSTNASTSYGSL